MIEIQPVNLFLNEVQGEPELVYTQVKSEFYGRLKANLLLIDRAGQQMVLQQQVIKQIEELQDLIQDYERQINEAIQYPGVITEMEKRNLQAAFQKLKLTEQEILTFFE